MSFDFNDLVVFEMANNHQGSLDHGLRIIEEMARVARRHGIRAAVKLQYRDLPDFVHRDYRDRTDVKHIPRFLSTMLGWDNFHALVMATREAGLLSMVTPFDEASVEKAVEHGVDIIKIASCSCMDWPLLDAIARTGKPVICSTGGCTLRDTDKIVTFLEHREVLDLALLHCIGMYPTPDSAQQLGFMRRMMARYPHCTVGYSGHEDPDNLRVVTAAVAMGAAILERHVGVPTEDISLNAYSMSPDQADRWVAELVAARELCALPKGDKIVSEAEIASLRSLARGVYAKEPLEEGALLEPSEVYFAMPCPEGQTTSKEYLPTMTASRAYAADAPVQERRCYDRVFAMREVVHEAKGLLREAGIATGSEFTLDLSHHYGMNQFRRFGAIIVNFFNREYCKKLIILLPGQQHPSHAHKVKEETFQVLHGDLQLVLDGEHIAMKPGDAQLVRRDQAHSFATKNGCVFEEISTTHIKGDSYYEDPAIARLDPIERKSSIESW